MNVITTCERDLPAGQDEHIRRLQQAGFPQTADFLTQRWWHTPPADDDLWFTVRGGDLIVAGVRVAHRDIRAGRRRLVAAGIGNVCSHPDHRGTGAAKACMLAAQEYIAASGKIDFGLLFCGEKVRGFYARLGWRLVDNRVVYAAGGAQSVKTSHIMIFPGRLDQSKWPAGEIDLAGPDW